MEDAHLEVTDISAAGLTAEELLDRVRRDVERLAELDPADVVAPATEVAELLGRLLEEVER